MPSLPISLQNQEEGMNIKMTLALSLCLGALGCGDSRTENKRSTIPHIGDVRELDYCMQSTYHCESTPDKFSQFRQQFNSSSFPAPHVGQRFAFLYTSGPGYAATNSKNPGLIAGIVNSIKGFFGSRQQDVQRSTASSTATSMDSMNLVCPPGQNCGNPPSWQAPLPSRPTPGTTGAPYIQNPQCPQGYNCGSPSAPYIQNPQCPQGYNCGAPVNPTAFDGGFYRSYAQGGIVTNGEMRNGQVGNTSESTLRHQLSTIVASIQPQNYEDYFFKNGVHYINVPSSQTWYGISFEVPLFANPVVVRQLGGNGSGYKITE